MANDEDLARIRQGAAIWNDWRAQNPECRVDLGAAYLRGADLSGVNLKEANLSGAYLRGADLSQAHLSWTNLSGADLEGANLSGANLEGANLSGANLSGADLSQANLEGANLSGADLSKANLEGANLEGANLSGADLFLANLSLANPRKAHLSEADRREAYLSWANLGGADLSKANPRKADRRGANLGGANLGGANLSGADLSWANLGGANLGGANLSGADLSWANLEGANLEGANLFEAALLRSTLIETNFADADLTGCRVYGISAWDLKLKGAKQRDLVITAPGQPEITVDNLEVAQFIYLLLHNEKIRSIIDTIGKKGVLLLGRFSGKRMALLERLREELRGRDFVPIVFNFERPEKSDFTETVRTLAGLCRFVIADITSPRSTPLELQATVPEYMIPFVPIMEEGEEPFAMFKDLWVKHDWVVAPLIYASVEQLVRGLDKEIINPALAKFDELMIRKAQELPVRRIGT